MKIFITMLFATLSLLNSTKSFSCGCPYSGESLKDTFIKYCRYVARTQAYTNPPYLGIDPDIRFFHRQQNFTLVEEEKISFGKAYSLLGQSNQKTTVNATRPHGLGCSTLNPFNTDDVVSITFVNKAAASTDYVSCGVNYVNLIALKTGAQPAKISSYNSDAELFHSGNIDYNIEDIFVVGSIDSYAQKPMALSDFTSQLPGWVNECDEAYQDQLLNNL